MRSSLSSLPALALTLGLTGCPKHVDFSGGSAVSDGRTQTSKAEEIVMRCLRGGTFVQDANGVYSVEGVDTRYFQVYFSDENRFSVTLPRHEVYSRREVGYRGAEVWIYDPVELTDKQRLCVEKEFSLMSGMKVFVFEGEVVKKQPFYIIYELNLADDGRLVTTP